MAKNKTTLPRIPRKRPRFPEVKGKTVHDVEVSITDYGCAIGIMFQDRTLARIHFQRKKRSEMLVLRYRSKRGVKNTTQKEKQSSPIFLKHLKCQT